jgi:hypothetical protein
VRLNVIAASDKRPLDNVVVTVDGNPLSPAALRRPVRLEPGIHVFTAHADGFADPPQKKLSILAGSPVDATFELGLPAGLLTVKPSVPDAIVQIDGREVGRGLWSGKLEAGTHRITASAPGYQITSAEVVVSSGASVEYPLMMLQFGEGPASYEAPVRKPPPKPKKGYLVPMVAYEAESMRVAPVLGEPVGGTKRSFTGGSFGLRGGYRLTRVFSIELHGQFGQLKDTYPIGTSSKESETQVIHWQLTPALRITTIGPLRFTASTGVGLHGLSVSSDINTVNTAGVPVPQTFKGSGVAASWLVDLGLQFDVGSLFLEAATFFDMHGVGTTREEVTNARMFLSSPGFRGGIRGGLGIQF